MSYHKKFTYIRDNCKSKLLDLQKSMCKQSQIPLVANYKNLYLEVEDNLDNFVSTKNNPIDFDSKFNNYENDCNKYYSLVRGNIYQECKYKLLSPFNILIFILLLILIILGFLGFRSKNKGTKILYFSISAIILLSIIILFFYKFRNFFI